MLTRVRSFDWIASLSLFLALVFMFIMHTSCMCSTCEWMNKFPLSFGSWHQLLSPIQWLNCIDCARNLNFPAEWYRSVLIDFSFGDLQVFLGIEALFGCHDYLHNRHGCVGQRLDYRRAHQVSENTKPDGRFHHQVLYKLFLIYQGGIGFLVIEIEFSVVFEWNPFDFGYRQAGKDSLKKCTNSRKITSALAFLYAHVPFRFFFIGFSQKKKIGPLRSVGWSGMYACISRLLTSLPTALMGSKSYKAEREGDDYSSLVCSAVLYKGSLKLLLPPGCSPPSLSLCVSHSLLAAPANMERARRVH